MKIWILNEEEETWYLKIIDIKEVDKIISLLGIKGSISSGEKYELYKLKLKYGEKIIIDVTSYNRILKELKKIWKTMK